MHVSQSLSKVLLLLLAVTFLAFADAQKLPNKQDISLRAPVNIKIDGKATEWNNQLQAYNKATDIYYTVSNDDNNIYLTIRVKLLEIKDKILRGGITLTINHGVDKKDLAPVKVTYPILRDADMSVVANLLGHKTFPQKNGDTTTVIKVKDLNQLLNEKSKLISVTGMEAVSEESISVYNDTGIKAVSQFDDLLIYTYELAIPLKYLTPIIKNGAKFSYNIKINEAAETKPHVIGAHEQLAPPVMTETLSPTDFWGEYTLAKK